MLAVLVYLTIFGVCKLDSARPRFLGAFSGTTFQHFYVCPGCTDHLCDKALYFAYFLRCHADITSGVAGAAYRRSVWSSYPLLWAHEVAPLSSLACGGMYVIYY